MPDHTAANNNPSNNHISTRIWSHCKAFVKQLISRKPMADIQREIDIRNKLARPLNWVHLLAIGLGCTIGMGIFSLSGQAAARYAGPSVIVSFIITGIAALLAALSYSELATMMPSSGATYTYTYAALGEYWAWVNGWNYALQYQLSAMSVVVSWSQYVSDFVTTVSDLNVTASVVQSPVAWDSTGEGFSVTGQVINIPAIVITIAISLLLFSGIYATAMVNLVLVVIKVVILLIFIFVCCKYVNRDNYTPFIPPNEGSFELFGVTGMLQGCTYVFFAYEGFEVVATVAQEAKKGRSISIPVATIGSVVISLLLYVGIATVMVGLISYKLLDSNTPLSEAIKATPYGLWLVIVMDLGAIVSLATVALTVLLAQTRIFYAMSLDGLLPSFFSRVHHRTKTPWISTLVSGVFCAVLAGIGPVDIVGEAASISTLITYIFTHIVVVVMRYTHNTEVQRGFYVPFGSWLLPTVGSLLCILFLKGVTKEAGYPFAVWTVLGQIFYFSYGFWYSKRRPSNLADSCSNLSGSAPSEANTTVNGAFSASELDLAGVTTESEV